MNKPKGYYFPYKSAFTGRPCVCIITLKSGNNKTGDIAQVWFLEMREDPMTLRKLNCEGSTCGTCPLQGGKGCYVRVEQAPLSVWRAYHRGNYELLTDPLYVAKARLGAYGDPGSMSIATWDRFMELLKADRWTGYTHAWRECFWLKEWCMASTTLVDDQEAQDMGWSTFCVLPPSTPEDQINCPAVTKGIQCKQCMRCCGRPGERAQQRITIASHGARAKKVYG